MVLFHADLTERSAALIVQGTELLAAEVCIAGTILENGVIARVLRAPYLVSVTARLFHVLASRLRLLSSPSRTLAVGLLGGLDIPRSVEEFARVSGSRRRSIERQLAALGIGSAKRFLDAVRVARAWDILTAKPASLQHVCDLAGFASVRRLSEQFQYFLATPVRRTIELDPRTVAAQLATKLVARSGDHSDCGGSSSEAHTAHVSFISAVSAAPRSLSDANP
jgi:hypothetical protein